MCEKFRRYISIKLDPVSTTFQNFADNTREVCSGNLQWTRLRGISAASAAFCFRARSLSLSGAIVKTDGRVEIVNHSPDLASGIFISR